MGARARHILLIIAIAAAAISCGGGPAPAAETARQPPAALPGITSLDALRGASVAATHGFIVRDPLAGAHVAAVDEALNFNCTPDTAAFAVYAVLPESTDLRSLDAGVAGNFWVMVADYDAGCWQPAGPAFDGAESYDLTGYTDLTSPDGWFYCAVVAYGEPEPAGNFLLSLDLTYDIPLDTETYYVATPADGGDDANPGSAALPWATLQHAADSVGPGDTVLAGPGDYAGFHLEQSGVTGHPVTFDGQGSARIVSDNQNTRDGINVEDWGEDSIHHVTVRGFTVTGATRAGIRFSGTESLHAHHITIADNVCDQNGRWGIFCGFNDDITVTGNVCSRSGTEHGIYLSNSCKRYVLRHNTCRDNYGCGIHNNGDLEAGGDGIMEWGYIEYNTCYGNGAGGGSALNFDTVRHCRIRGNLCYANHSSGISIYSVSGLGSADNYVINNTVITGTDGRWCLNLKDATANTVAYNNIFLSDHDWRGSIDIGADCTGLDSDYNIVMDRFVIGEGGVLSLADWRTAMGTDAHSFTAAPAELFVDIPGADFHIIYGGPAHDAGTMLGVEFSPMPAYDADGDYRPDGAQYDIGYDEIAGSWD